MDTKRLHTCHHEGSVSNEVHTYGWIELLTQGATSREKKNPWKYSPALVPLQNQYVAMSDP